jgi:predicted 3-demethylubiquinone-9 3-methyltransferase (glyoxalase superfamily)
MRTIIPNLWFDSQAEEAARFYTSVFPNSKVGQITRYSEDVSAVAGRPVGSVMTVEFELDGNPFLGLNGGPIFKFTEAVSFIINCDSQEEIDRYWSALTADGGAESQCGWLKDRFGLSWQLVPTELPQLLDGSKDPEAPARVMRSVLQMKKIDLDALRRAHEGRTS